MSENKKTFEFEALPSGDCECFVFAVNKETFIKLTGKEPKEFDKSDFIEDTYMIYPDVLFRKQLDENGNVKKLKIKVEIEI